MEIGDRFLQGVLLVDNAGGQVCEFLLRQVQFPAHFPDAVAGALILVENALDLF